MPNYIPNAPLNPDNYRDAGGLVPFFWTIISEVKPYFQVKSTVSADFFCHYLLLN
ncbi:MAG: hypothetical protein SGJ10_14695 [Bacteroidota bacterium]|nr:hypothetical protein [Bacteroidota bacterium]